MGLNGRGHLFYVQVIGFTYEKALWTNEFFISELYPLHMKMRDSLHTGGAATITPPLSVDSDDGVLSAMPEDFADGEDEEEEEDDDDKLEESTQHTVLPDSQDLFLTLTEIPSQPNEAKEGTSAANVSSLPPPFQRLSQIRRRKKCIHEEMFSELMQSSDTELSRMCGGTQ
ncbi:hypothetical protein UY3_12081 [Chelonia mydas]|uniref:Uncharacterized protein n=1 Tax=Chelonia mydas TaxID=8469 RepID=M7AZ04_CHEMY|nr:hypothetical protein UY3_12081 [Chelonia mydas]